MSSERNLALIKRYYKRFGDTSGCWNRVISELLSTVFAKVEHWFGDAGQLQNESRVLLLRQAE